MPDGGVVPLVEEVAEPLVVVRKIPGDRLSLVRIGSDLVFGMGRGSDIPRICCWKA